MVEKLEKSINSRVQVGKISIGLLGNVELKNVIIAERDNLAELKVPHDERSTLESGALNLVSVSFHVFLLDILSRKVTIKSIMVDGMLVKMELLEDGSSSIEKLFAKPDKEKNVKGDSFNAKDNDDFVTPIESIEFNDVDFELLIEKTQLQIKGTGVCLRLS